MPGMIRAAATAIATAFAALLAAAALSACGQKGPLKLPEPEKPKPASTSP